MNIMLNGNEWQHEGALTVAALLIELKLTGNLAVERNLHIVPRSAYGETELAEGDRIEIVHFIGGG